MTLAPGVAARPRVLLVEDDASIRQFVAMALEDHPLELVECPNLCAARAALAGVPAALVLLDMMLPDGSGLELLRDTAWRRGAGAARWVVFSAGLSPAMTAELAQLDVERLLHKPVSLAALCGCVDDALRAAQDARGPVAAAPGGLWSTSTADPPASDALDGSTTAEAQAVEAYFEGDHALFVQMKQRARYQFRQDMAAGDAALATGDLKALRRVVHSLKTILRMLGHPQASRLARDLENLLAAGSHAHWPQLWTGLRQRILDLANG